MYLHVYMYVFQNTLYTGSVVDVLLLYTSNTLACRTLDVITTKLCSVDHSFLKTSTQ